MRIVFAVLAALSLVGCATSNFSSLDAGEKGKSSLVVADLEAVKASIRNAIHQQDPNAAVHESFDGRFDWVSNTVGYRLEMFVGTGLDGNKQEVKGYFYKISTDMTGYDIEPLVESIKSAFASHGLKTEAVSLLSQSTMVQEAQALAEKAQACFAGMADDSRFAVIKTKISFGNASDQTFAMLTDNSKPAPEERQAIRIWGQVREECLALQRTANTALGTTPQIKVLMDTLMTNQQSLIAQLYLGNLTYGDFAAKRQTMANTFKESASNIEAELKKEEKESMDRAEMTHAISNIRLTTSCSYIAGTMYCN